MGLGLQDLRVWQEAVALAALVVRSFSKTRSDVRAFAEHAIMTAAAVGENVAEGFGERIPADQEKGFRAAQVELLKLETQLAIARLAELLSASRHAEMVARIAAVNRLLSGFLTYLDRQTNEEGGAKVAAI